MLRTLEIRDLLIIDHLELEFRPGLNVLTGETGAGKSILLDSLGFVLGWRGRADLVRQGAANGEVTAVFDLPEGHPAHAVLDEGGLPGGDELILRRVNAADGRKTAWINDRRASGDTLRALSETLVELHGQHDDRGLLNASGHRAMLDGFAGHGDLLNDTRDAWRAASAARKALEEKTAALAAVQAEEDFIRHAVAELEELSPVAGEEAELDTRRRTMQAAERIRTDVGRALQALGGDGAEGAASDALRWLEGAVDHAEEVLDPPIAALGRALVELGEAQAGVETALDALEFDPLELERTEERLFAIRALARKHGVSPEELVDLSARLRRQLDALDAGVEDLAEAQQAVREAEAAYDRAALTLSDARRNAAANLDDDITQELAPLKMERAVFRTEIADGDAGPDGRDTVTFTVATNPGAPAGPLNKIASGGELSRFLLAMKVCLTRGVSGLTLIFDEIDRGVGGATADAVGRRLASLAEEGQVLVVTHSPQVAARGSHHWQVQKRLEDGATLSNVAALDEAMRVDEIARMLAGDTLTDEARAAARALLAG
ncbi:MAG: DNA repair protein RecN [Paracoccaceae bacterium]